MNWLTSLAARFRPTKPSEPEPWPIGWFCCVWESQGSRPTFTARVLGRDAITGNLWLELYDFFGADQVTRALVDPVKTELTFHATSADAQAVFDTYHQEKAPEPEPRGLRTLGGRNDAI